MDRLRAELADQQSRRENVSVRAGRISSVLEAGGRLDPEDFDDHDDVAHHYETTLRPTLTDLDPIQKAAAIRGYVEETRIAPDAAIKSLLGLTATDDAGTRIAAARAVTETFAIDPTARDKVPPVLSLHAETMAQLADTDSIPPDDIAKTADALFGKGTPGASANWPKPTLIQLAMAGITGGSSAANQRVNFLERGPAVRDTFPLGLIRRHLRDQSLLIKWCRRLKNRAVDHAVVGRPGRQNQDYR